ncbi:MAG: hypothetical protein QHH80_13485 [Anaerolineae bacterium]|nr:hypothetical protein [Anaerolineae bacterium]
MRRRILRTGLLALVAVVLVVGALAMTSSNYRLDWFTPGTSGGGGTSSSSNYVAHITVGQTAIGTMSSPNYKANLGYWYGLVRIFRRFLPVVMENKGY